MDPTQNMWISKYLSKHLRHEPEALGLTLESGGWTSVTELLAACARNQFPISKDELAQVVRDCKKQRFAFDESGTKIRANQGHSVEIDLELEPTAPPSILYHGTGEKAVGSILAGGLHRMTRNHVHLSADEETAFKVGQRHGKPVIFEVNSAGMRCRGFLFYRSANGVWLTEHVPVEFLSLKGKQR